MNATFQKTSGACNKSSVFILNSFRSYSEKTRCEFFVKGSNKQMLPRGCCYKALGGSGGFPTCLLPALALGVQAAGDGCSKRQLPATNLLEIGCDKERTT